MKKVMVTLISLATLGLGIVVPLQANAAQPTSQTTQVSQSQRQPQRQHQYRIQYRRHHQTRWINDGTYRNRTDAQRAARQYQRRGYEVRMITI